MEWAHRAFFLSLLCLTFSAAFFSFAYKADAQAPSVVISPPTQDVSMHSSQTVAVDVSVTSASGLYGYQYDIQYDPNVLTLADNGVAEGTFLKSDGAIIFCITPDTSVSGNIRNIACTRQATASGTSGSGTLNRITFSIRSEIAPPLTTQIRLANVKLSNINSQPITYTSANGNANIKACTAGQTKVCGSNVGECRQGTLTCNINNEWPVSSPSTCVGATWFKAEECNGLDDNCDGQIDKDASGQSLTTSCSNLGKLGRCSVGTATCSSGAWTGCQQPTQEICYNGIDEDCDGSDSTCKGDITGCSDGSSDGCINIEDLSAVAADFGRTSGFTNPGSDTDGNGEVNIFDLVAVAKDFGSGTCRTC